MLNQDESNPFIFFVTLEEGLPSAFYALDRHFKDMGYIFVPVKIDQLQTLLASSDQSQIMVVSSVTNFKDYQLFNQKVRGLLRYFLKSKRLTFMLLSSFTKLDDTENFSLFKNYYFMKYPLNAETLSMKIFQYLEFKSDQSTRWPGGKKSSVVGGVV